MVPLNRNKPGSKKRSRMSGSSFVFPKEKRYPIDTINRARNALSRVAQHGSPQEKEKVRRAVYRKFPSLKKSKS